MTIRDFKYDLNLGTVNFMPFLNSQNPAALPVGTTPNPPVVPEFTPAAYLALLITTMLMVAAGLKRKTEIKH